jgi:hypothetical protein
MTATEYLDRPPSGWFVLDVMKRRLRGHDRVALMANVHPEDIRRGAFDRVAYKEGWLKIPGEYRNRDAAWDEMDNLIATRH